MGQEEENVGSKLQRFRICKKIKKQLRQLIRRKNHCSSKINGKREKENDKRQYCALLRSGLEFKLFIKSTIH